ncbi:MAG: glutathione S-transferase family protein [Myxococcota bacterium]
MKLYLTEGSPACKKVLATVRAVDAKDIESIPVSPLTGETHTEDYLRMNGNGKVPTLVDGELTLWESNAIMQYLADKFGGDAIFPKDPVTRADIVRWQFWEANHYNQAANAILSETTFKQLLGIEGGPNEAILQSATKDFHRFAKVLDDHLTDRAFLVGETVTLADFSVAMFTPFVTADETTVPVKDYAALTRWYGAMREYVH